MPIRTDIDMETGIIRKTYSGDIYLDDILSEFENTARVSDAGKRRRLIVDFRSSTPRLSPDEVSKAVEKAKKMRDEFPDKIAILSEEPQSTALSLLFEKRTAGTYDCRVFSTEDAALDWLTEE